jgi:hypothetical protein
MQRRTDGWGAHSEIVHTGSGGQHFSGPDRERRVVSIAQIVRTVVDERGLARDGFRICNEEKLDVDLAGLSNLF